MIELTITDEPNTDPEFLGELARRKAMITDITDCIKAGGHDVYGDTLLALAFRTETELKHICRELNIKV